MKRIIHLPGEHDEIGCPMAGFIPDASTAGRDVEKVNIILLRV